MRSINELTNEELGRAFRKLLAGDGEREGVNFHLLNEDLLELLDEHEGDPDDSKGIIGFTDAFLRICVDDLGIWQFSSIDSDKEEE